jgi:signal transduction histidine kinase
MRDTAPRLERHHWPRGHWSEILWVAFAAANYAAMILWPAWKTIPFHFLWISLALLYGFRVWPVRPTLLVLSGVVITTVACLWLGPIRGVSLWSEMLSVPLMAGMFLAMVWHARRHMEAQRAVVERAEAHRSLLATQERFAHDASHELRTPVTIARGHLELLRGRIGSTPEIAVALDELTRIDAITERLLLLATIEQPDFVKPVEIELEPLLEEVFMRWSGAAPRSWRLGPLADGSLFVDPERLRVALDALIENAVNYSEPGGAIELRARRDGRTGISIEVQDEGCGVPPESLERIFDRFARADPARTRAAGGVGLGLAIVDATVKAHGGSATVLNTSGGCTFALRLPRFAPATTDDRSSHASGSADRELWAPPDAGVDWRVLPAPPALGSAPGGSLP